MFLARLVLVVLALLGFAFGRPLAEAQSVSKVVVFGDSLSDTGNIAHLVQAATGPASIRYPADIPGLADYTDGRFTDGADTQPAAQAYFGVWVEQLAASFAAKPAVKNSLDGGTNYAFGDATTEDGTRTITEGPLSVTLENMGQQVSDYLATSPTPNAATLYVLWGGSNDLFADSSTASATAAAAREAALVQRLVNAGATAFIVPNVPPLGAFRTGDAATALNAASATFAQQLATDLAQVKATAAAKGVALTIYQPDVLTLFGTVASAPMSVGLGNVTSAAQNVPGSPDVYLIWDGLHPTTTGHHYVAATTANLFTPLVASATTLSAPATVVAGSAVTLTATVAAGSGTGAKPTGLVTFYSGTTVVASAVLDATGKGAATFTPGAASTPALTAVYAGDTTYAVSASASQPLAVLGAAVGTTTTLSSSNLNANVGAAVTFTATVTPAVSTSGTPAGTVTFLNGTTALGTGTLSNGVATLTTSSLAAGTYSVTASYAANGVFAGSTSGAISQVVVAPVGFAPSVTPPSLTVKAGNSASTVLTAVTVNGDSLPSSITVACGTLPAHFSCSFSSTTLTFAPSGSTPASPKATLTIATNVATAAGLELPARLGRWRAAPVYSAMLLPLCAGWFGVGVRRRRLGKGMPYGVLFAVVSLGTLLGLAGCGSSSSNNAAAGTYSVPVLFTPSSGTAQTVNVQVTVQ